MVKSDPKSFWRYANSLSLFGNTQILVSKHVVADRLSNLNPSKSPGPAGWPLLALKKAALQISLLLSILFNKSLQTGLLPNDWKRAHVIRRVIMFWQPTTDQLA